MRKCRIHVFCPVCGQAIIYDMYAPNSSLYHHKEFGLVCSRGCFLKAELKYAAMILGKDEVVLEKERGKG